MKWKGVLLVPCAMAVLMIAVTAPGSFAQPVKTEITADLTHIPDLEPPVIDGMLDDEVWQYATQGRAPAGSWRVSINPDYDADDPVQPGVVEGSDTPEDQFDDCSFRVWTVYDSEYLYVAVAVLDLDMVTRLPAGDEDGSTWYDDSCEIFIDGNHNRVSGNVNSHPEEYATGGQFVLTAVNARRDAEAGDPTFGEGADAEWYGMAMENESFTGYDYEFRVKLSKIGNPQLGDTVGFNVAVNDADDPGSTTNDYQLRWTGMAHQEDTYGDLYFGRRVLTAPLITGEITIDGKMDEADWASADKGMAGVPYGPFEGTTIPRDLADLSCDIYVMHDATWLYVAIDVNDAEVIADSAEPGSEDQSTWYDDSAEIFIDGNHSHTPGRTGEIGIGLGGQFVITTVNAWRDNEADNPYYGETDDNDWYALSTLTGDGYIAEFRVKKESFFDPVDTEIIGFEVAINEDDTDPPEEKDTGFQINWNGHPHNEASYGDLILGGPPTPILNWELH